MNRIVADRTGQDVRDWTEDRERILPKQEGRTKNDKLAQVRDAESNNVRFGLILNPLMMS